MPNNRTEKILQAVPVIIVGSHYDQIPVHCQQDVKLSTQSLVNEMKVKYVAGEVIFVRKLLCIFV